MRQNLLDEVSASTRYAPCAATDAPPQPHEQRIQAVQALRRRRDHEAAFTLGAARLTGQSWSHAEQGRSMR